VGVGHRSTSSTWRVVALVLGAATCGVLGLLGLGEVLLLRMSLPTTPAARAWRVFGLTTGLFAASVLVLQSHASWVVGLTWALLFGGLLVGPGLLVGCRPCDALDGRLLPRSEP
jgi:hypothetical protein